MRRGRYTITLTSGERKVVLAYSASGAVGCFPGRTAKVVKGDYRLQAIRHEATTRKVAWWDFNLAAIRAAFEAMTGEQLPAQLVLKKGKATTQQRGVFSTNALTGAMEVRIARNLEPEQANRTLWHELAHVAQCVRMGGVGSWAAYCKAANRDGTGYRNRAHEREAREWEVLAETDCLLRTRA